jgi:hypothetical protein
MFLVSLFWRWDAGADSGKIFGVFRVKNHDFTPKNHIFSIAEGGAKMFEVFRVKNHDFTPKNHIFSNFRGGARRVRPPPPEFLNRLLNFYETLHSCSTQPADVHEGIPLLSKI